MTEKVSQSERPLAFATRVHEEALAGTQLVSFTPAEDGRTRVELKLDYELAKGGALRALADVLFIRRALNQALQRTLARFAAEAAEEAGSVACRGPPTRRNESVYVFKAAVVGAGTMGGEIAQVIASAGVDVVLKDVEQKFVDQGLEKAKQVTQGQLGSLVKKEKISQDDADKQAEEIIGRITGTTEYEGFGDVDFVVEAVPERMQIKQAVFAELDAVTPGHAILSSNTSALSISEMGEATSRPDKVVGFHFFYPASMMRLIEVIEGDETSPETVQAASNFAQQIKKTPIKCGEAPGLRRQPHPELRRSRRSGAFRRRRGSTSRSWTRSSRSRRRPRWARSS